MVKVSSFLEPGLRTEADGLAIALLSKDNFTPINLQQSTSAVDGYAEGVTLNTRFGSFPHSTLINVPWGSQVRASVVDTGSRGRKRRRDATEDEETPTQSGQDQDVPIDPSAPAKKAITAASGFIHILRPSAELWTSSLPHRTQVVYTPDYSYILSRIRARPGTRIIEAGAGSGSFTHASARAVYSGYPTSPDDRKGKVWSFEFHEARFHRMEEEIKGHNLEGLVQITHRDVYNDGFLVDGQSPQATSVFLDLPKPWEALSGLQQSKQIDPKTGKPISPLDRRQSVHICTFSPCIEQVTRTVQELRTQGWIDVDMVEVSHKRLNVIRDRIGINLLADKGVNTSPADVSEALTRLKEVGKKTQDFHKAQFSKATKSEDQMDVDSPSKQGNNATVANDETRSEKTWMQGRLVHRSEPELKTHTSYLVFAILPPEWSDEEEAAAMAKWPCGNEAKTIGNISKDVRRKEKRDMLEAKKQKKQKARESRAQQDATQQLSQADDA
ncbi:tRNA methyltransferase complex GCD14 subunit domain-containing protein [Sarocladium implicatum]|nr:tRNA methyltransferase complex GCD14 subunit domain-containing protein [Sarocladium implicatum]